MPGCTHWRQAQTINLGHYITDQVETARKTVFLLEDIYKRTNFSPLGSATFAGTGWPVNRHRSMHILGFNGLL